jgi:hypothetical protein
MTKTRRNLTIYSGVMLLFGLILTIVFVTIYDRIEVTSTFGGKSLHLGSYILRSYEEDEKDGQTYVSFEVSEAKDFIDKHVVTHEFYIGEKFTTNNSLSNYYLFLVEDVLFTLKYDEDLLTFYLYSGFIDLEHEGQTYRMPYIEMNENIFDQGIFSSFADLKAYYEKISTSDIDDENQEITVLAYLKNEENNSIIISETIGVVLDYSGDDVLINFN